MLLQLPFILLQAFYLYINPGSPIVEKKHTTAPGPAHSLSKMTLVQNPKIFSYFCKVLSAAGIASITFHSFDKRCCTVDDARNVKWRHIMHVAFMILSTLQWIVKSNKSPMEEIVAIVFVSMHFTAFILIHEERNKKHEIVQFCSALFHFDKTYPRVTTAEGKHFRTRINMVMIYSMMISSVALPIGFGPGVHWLNPCQASLVGYWLIPECNLLLQFNLSNLLVTLIKSVVIFMNVGMWSMTIGSAVFTVGALATLCVSSIQQFTQR